MPPSGSPEVTCFGNGFHRQRWQVINSILLYFLVYGCRAAPRLKDADFSEEKARELYHLVCASVIICDTTQDIWKLLK